MLKVKFPTHSASPEIEFFLTDLAKIQKFDEVEVSISLYPYQSELKANHFHFDPYEDYVEDLVEGQRSTYQNLHSTAPQGYGLLLGGTILSYFMIFHPDLLISVESLVSIFAAYTVGKEIWQDIDVFLQDLTQAWRVRWAQQSFYYGLQQFGTFQRFWQLARLKRYGYQLFLPEELDFISHSNSKTVEMLFETKYFPQGQADTMRVLRVAFEKSVHSVVATERSLIIARVALVKKVLGLRFVTEYYQAYDQGKVGTLDLNNVWNLKKTLLKKMITFGRVVWFTAKTQLVDKKIYP